MNIIRWIQQEDDHEQPPVESYPLDIRVRAMERAVAAKIHLETYYKDVLTEWPTVRDLRLERFKRRLEASLDLDGELKQGLQTTFFRRESDHLRRTRVLKHESFKAGSSLVDDESGPCVKYYKSLKILGKGSFGVVRLVRERHGVNTDLSNGGQGGKTFAMKVIRKTNMIRSCQEGHLRAERDFLIASEMSDWYAADHFLRYPDET